MDPLHLAEVVDFSALTDEELACVAGQPGGRVAFKALALRFRPLIKQHCREFRRRYRLSWEDAREACQHGIVILRRLAADFARLTAAARQVGTFGAFVHVRLRGRLQHWLRARKRKRHRWLLVGSTAILQQLATTVGLNSPCVSSLRAREEDPVTAAEKKELEYRVYYELNQLPRPTQQLLRAWLEGMGLSRLARRWGLSIRALQLRLRKCLAMLEPRLRPLVD
jgi:RNA polymerase sigma factor (sigma-70 family)